MNCDICGGTGGGTCLGATQVRSAAKKGFNPFRMGLFPRELLASSSRTEEDAYRNWLHMVEQNETDWDLCDGCFAGIKPYVPDASRPSDKHGGHRLELTGDPAVDEMLRPFREHVENERRKGPGGPSDSPKPGGGCFIATACLGSADHPDVEVLRRFRDEVLVGTFFGAKLAHLYSVFSPPIARRLDRNRWARFLIRVFVVRPCSSLISILRRTDADRQ